VISPFRRWWQAIQFWARSVPGRPLSREKI
jgi:hypothetical protein